MAYKKKEGGNSPAKQTDIKGLIQKGIGMYLKPYQKGYNYLKENVTKIKGYMDGDDEVKKVKPKKAEKIVQQKKTNGAIVNNMQQQLKQERENKLKDLPQKGANPSPKKQTLEREKFDVVDPRDKNMNKQINRMNDNNYDLIEGNKNNNYQIGG